MNQVKGRIFMEENREEQLWLEYEEKVRMLEERYAESMMKLRDIPGMLPEKQLVQNREQVMGQIMQKMTELGSQFRKKMDMLTDEFVTKMSGLGV